MRPSLFEQADFFRGVEPCKTPKTKAGFQIVDLITKNL